MPELPEVETTRRGLAGPLNGATISALTCRVPALRWPLDPALADQLIGQRIDAIDRRAKYLLLRVGEGTLVIHLGMSGSLRVLDAASLPAPGRHDHVDLTTSVGVLRYHDPRRFGFWLYDDDQRDLRFAQLGPEPLSDRFNGDSLHQSLQTRSVGIKQAIMDQKIVVGVGNIYASEALHLAGIRPGIDACRLSRLRCERLCRAIKQTLHAAIESGGSTLRDFSQSDGKPGYFQHAHRVYGREGQPCADCLQPIRKRVDGGRSTFYCALCQR
ncbi:bifunctional DNA-formamidopyrimidine glycosylase/DNA-(apurinic or apyrimidinic site) lyase [Gammaproteobacteria bacterium]|nr:bifunctional DNA-formamidopyrimidine glycosylase/DNA-(apurinic or apyrimidinic site) lyase [Gammaproteobacteria bacterium]